MQDLKKKIKNLSKEFYQEIVGIRRMLHANPELSTKEYKTSETIAKKLTEYNIPFMKGMAGTGIVAEIRGKGKSDKTIALRADMDALPITEMNDIDYKSKNKGVMHACGHDVHISVLLGAAKILNTLSDSFSGTVKLIFQPSEEQFPGGAITMINEGVLENPTPDFIIGEHVMPALETGKIGVKSGKFTASTDELYFTVKGKGGHAATPYANTDTILIAAQIIIALQQIVSRKARPSIPTVLSIGRVIADGRTNIIPNEVKMEGILRTFDEAWRRQALEKIIEISKGIAKTLGGDCDVSIAHGYPFLNNDETLTKNVKKYAQEYLGDDNVVDLDIETISEDFAYYAQRLPSCFYKLGVGNKAKGIDSDLHSSTFNVDEKSIEYGMGLMAWVTVNQLKK